MLLEQSCGKASQLPGVQGVRDAMVKNCAMRGAADDARGTRESGAFSTAYVDVCKKSLWIDALSH
jgi:hypothetical protein